MHSKVLWVQQLLAGWVGKTEQAGLGLGVGWGFFVFSTGWLLVYSPEYYGCLLFVCVTSEVSGGGGGNIHKLKVMLTAVTYCLLFVCPQLWFRWTETRSGFSCVTLQDR